MNKTVARFAIDIDRIDQFAFRVRFDRGDLPERESPLLLEQGARAGGSADERGRSGARTK
jgi:hypothetical protein